jgi:hypothetical protein
MSGKSHILQRRSGGTSLRLLVIIYFIAEITPALQIFRFLQAQRLRE